MSDDLGNKGALAEIATERSRQIDAEGWTPEHDDHHNKGELALAGALYASPLQLFKVEVIEPENELGGYEVASPGCVEWSDPWPFKSSRHVRHDLDVEVNDGDGRQKHDRRRQLVIAAALILAEIDRLDRLAAKAPKP